MDVRICWFVDLISGLVRWYFRVVGLSAAEVGGCVLERGVE